MFGEDFVGKIGASFESKRLGEYQRVIAVEEKSCYLFLRLGSCYCSGVNCVEYYLGHFEAVDWCYEVLLWNWDSYWIRSLIFVENWRIPSTDRKEGRVLRGGVGLFMAALISSRNFHAGFAGGGSPRKPSPTISTPAAQGSPWSSSTRVVYPNICLQVLPKRQLLTTNSFHDRSRLLSSCSCKIETPCTRIGRRCLFFNHASWCFCSSTRSLCSLHRHRLVTLELHTPDGYVTHASETLPNWLSVHESELQECSWVFERCASSACWRFDVI